MDWDRLRIFYVVASQGSLSAAERILHVTQSALSRQIGQLEHEVRSRLFERHARGLKLTEAGHTLFPVAKKIYLQLLAAQAELSDQHEQTAGSLSLVIPKTYGTFWLIRHLPEFKKLFPNIQISIVSNEASDYVHMIREDVYVQVTTIAPPESSECTSHLLCSYGQYVFAGVDYIQENGMPTSVNDLDNHQLIACYDAAYVRQDIYELMNPLLFLGTKERPRQHQFLVDDFHSVLVAAESNLGLATLPLYIARQSQRLIEIQLTDILVQKTSTFSKFLVYPDYLRKFRRVEVFRDFIMQKAKEISLWEH